MKRHRLSLRHIEDHLVVGSDRAWGVYAIPPVHDELVSADRREQRVHGIALALGALAGAEGHLLVTPSPVDPQAIADRVRAATAYPAPGFAAYLERLAAHEEGGRFTRPSVSLAVTLGKRTRRPRRGAALAAKELQAWRERADALGRLLYGGWLRARPMPAEGIAHLVRRSFWRGLTPPPEPASRTAAIRELVDGTVSNRLHSLVLSQGSRQSHVALLCLAHFPELLPFPGGEWLSVLSSFTFPVEASVRFRVVPAREAAGHARRQLAHTTDQARHIAGTSAELPLALAAARDQARELEYRLGRDREPLCYSWTRLVVAAPSPELLDERVAEVVDAYRDLSIDVVRPSGDQLSLFLETLPGERLGVSAYQQRQALHTLAGSMFLGTTDVGDDTGLYIGVTTGKARSPVHLDPLRAARVNRPTGIALTGEPGAGKTTAAGLLTYQMALRGASCLVLDPKNEMAGLARLPGLAGARVVELSSAREGLLDPYALAADADEGALLAVEALTLLLPGLSGVEEAALVIAAGDEALTPSPALSGVLDRLAHSDDPVAHRLGTALSSYTRYPLARLLVGRGGPAPDLGDGSITVLQIRGLVLPEPGSARSEHSLAERVGQAVLFGLTALASGRAHRDRSRPKAIVIDEAWALTATRPGAALVERLARTGRSANTVLVLVSQNASDLLNEQVTNCLGVKMAFRSGSPAEIEAVLTLLDLEATSEHAALVAGLGNGECVLSDLSGRAAPVAVELIEEDLAAALDTTPHSMSEVSA